MPNTGIVAHFSRNRYQYRFRQTVLSGVSTRALLAVMYVSATGAGACFAVCSADPHLTLTKHTFWKWERIAIHFRTVDVRTHSLD